MRVHGVRIRRTPRSRCRSEVKANWQRTVHTFRCLTASQPHEFNVAGDHGSNKIRRRYRTNACSVAELQSFPWTVVARRDSLTRMTGARVTAIVLNFSHRLGAIEDAPKQRGWHDYGREQEVLPSHPTPYLSTIEVPLHFPIFPLPSLSFVVDVARSSLLAIRLDSPSVDRYITGRCRRVLCARGMRVVARGRCRELADIALV